PTSLDSIYSSRIDSVIIYDVPPELLNTYLEILQNTNSQLSLSHNPLALAIGFLGVLFTIPAIAAGWFIYRQGKEFEERQNFFIQNASNEYQALIDSYKQSIDSYIDRIKADAKEIEAQVKSYHSRTEKLDEAEQPVKTKDLMNRLTEIRSELQKIPGKKPSIFSQTIFPRFESNGKLTC